MRKKGPLCEFQNTVPERTFPPQKPFTLKGIGNNIVSSPYLFVNKMSDNVHRSQYDSPLKNRVIGAIKLGGKIREAARLFEVPESCARFWWSRFKKTGTTHNQPRSGRPRKVSTGGRKKLIEHAIKHRRLSLRALGKTLNPQISTNTTRRILADAGYHRRVARRKPYLKPLHRKFRREWAERHASWNANLWKHIIWSDECYIHINDKNGRIYVTRRPDEALDDECVINAFNSSDIKVMVWGCFTQNKKGPLVVLEYPGGKGGGMNTSRYIDQVLSGPLLTFYHNMKRSRRYMKLQQDNAPCHTSKKTMQWMSKNRIALFDHPPSSPDLNPIENIWHLLKNHVRSRPRTPTSTAELIQAVRDAWDSISIDTINSLVSSMPDRVDAVLAAEGGHTKY